jgi:hypothetical protein
LGTPARPPPEGGPAGALVAAGPAPCAPRGSGWASDGGTARTALTGGGVILPATPSPGTARFTGAGSRVATTGRLMTWGGGATRTGRATPTTLCGAG